MKQIGKIYTAVDADELEVGDIVQVADCPRDYRKFISDDVLEEIREDRFLCRFIVNDEKYPLAKLICPKKHTGVYKAWKNGTKIAHKIPALRQWYPTDNPSWAEDEEFRTIEPVHGTEENLEAKYVLAWSFEGNCCERYSYPHMG